MSGQLQSGTRVCVLGQVPSATERPAVAAAAFFKCLPRRTPRAHGAATAIAIRYTAHNADVVLVFATC